MHNCAYCRNPLTPRSEWKGADGGLYCNEFCADASETAGALTIPPAGMPDRAASVLAKAMDAVQMG